MRPLVYVWEFVTMLYSAHSRVFCVFLNPLLIIMSQQRDLWSDTKGRNDANKATKGGLRTSKLDSVHPLLR